MLNSPELLEDIKYTDIPLVERDLSWLSFNARVLQEAEDHSNPLFERIKFLAIYSANLGEFFGVRVSQHRNLMRIKKKDKKALTYNPKEVLHELLDVVKKQQERFNFIFEKQIIPELEQNNIHLLRRLDLSDEQLDFVEEYFHQFMLPFVQPVLLIKHKIKPFLNNSALYMMVMMKEKDVKKAKYSYALAKIPSDHLPRFIVLPSSGERHDLIYLDDIVRHSISFLFPGYEIEDCFSVKLTRDAELYIDDEFSGDLLQKIKSSLNKRDVGPAARLVYDHEMPEEMLDFLLDALELENMDLIPEGRYHNNFDLFKFPSFGMDHLKLKPYETLKYHELEGAASIFHEMNQKDHLIMVPFHSYESTVKFFEEAANDPDVTHLKIIQYRVAKESRIMNALRMAAAKGKNVSAFVEVKARFDEEANLKWGEELEKAGVHVYYSFPGLKVHAKTALVRKVVDGVPKLYCYLSTGNFHEVTAKIYSDFSLFTTDPRICNEVARVFSVIETEQIPTEPFEHLLVGQFNLKEDLIGMVRQEIENAKNDLKAEIILKVNSLQDPVMINWLYKASNAGVSVKIICRGICCLVPQMKGWSENIEVISIVDRYLEHARVFAFHNNGDTKLFLSSADWMKRNLNYRIEVAFPIYDERVKKCVMSVLNLQLNDSIKARVIDKDQLNEYKRGSNGIKFQSQEETYFYFKRKQEQYLQELEEENEN